ncbi:MAG TPA: 3-phosphoserine/phosphohydroxythreonine transaminase [Oligoflexia bacterium]|nr:3-phosphoserine/phosphohydroxythreonine transaminase [Oligoflexia bacterium]HMP49535.1 3-phosphoserine/phosphohydroxythreonine transaminase [Oligoflexia bacterium]
MRVHNFSGGPSTLPEEVLQRCKESVLEFEAEGMGIFELGHRSKAFSRILDEIKSDLKELLEIPDSHEILFCTGGASLQFSMIPLNLGSLESREVSGNYYLLSGHWAKAAMAEALSIAGASVAGSSEENGFRILPDVTEDISCASYLHFTSNNTIYGTQLRGEPSGVPVSVPLLCDASSDILSRPIDVSKYGLIYAGAQKNMGTAGVTLVIIRRDLIKKKRSGVPVLLQYETYRESDSLYNTPPVSAIIVMREMLKWTRKQGTLEEIGRISERKSKMLYDFIDSSDFYQGFADSASRSCMNITFNLVDRVFEERFLSFMNSHGVVGLSGHRSVEGFRASLYNSVSEEKVKILVELMREFESVI